MVVATRFLLLCAVVLALTAIAVAQLPPPPPPPDSLPPLPAGWYHNGAPGPICDNNCPPDNLQGLRIEWADSYLYQYPGNDPLYWYAQVVYRNMGSTTFTLHCRGGDPTQAKEHIRGPSGYIGYVAAEETYCSRNPDLTFSIEPGGAYYGWAIFHNLPWGRQGEEGEVSLEWGDKGSSPWVDPWYSPYAQFPPPFECPTELMTLGTCKVPREPQGAADNLIVLVHGCCTTATDVVNDWDSLGRAIGAEILHDQPPGTWEIVVKDWSDHTDKWPQGDEALFETYAKIAYEAAENDGFFFGKAIANHNYTYVHLIGHSTGARLIDEAALELSTIPNKPLTYLTFLDAYTPSGDQYGLYSDYAEHYVDRHLPNTDACLSNAFNFDI